MNSCGADLTDGLIHEEHGNEFLVATYLNFGIFALFQLDLKKLYCIQDAPFI